MNNDLNLSQSTMCGGEAPLDPNVLLSLMNSLFEPLIAARLIRLSFITLMPIVGMECHVK